jgi:magnesium-transporting ATPase (P-type)
MTDQKKYSKPQGIHIPSKPWTHSVRDVLKDLQVSVDQGLKNTEVKKRRKRFGSNRLRQIKKRGCGPSWPISSKA